MSLYLRLKRRLGYDTTETVSHTMPVYEYRVIHTTGDVSEVIAHGYTTDGAFARFYIYTDCYVWDLFRYSVSAHGQTINRVLESIKEIKHEKVGETEFTAVVDTADSTVLQKDVETNASGQETLVD